MVFVIAEAGVNHNGDIKLAKQLIDAAADAGADAVKFQTFKAERLVSRSSPLAKYQAANTSAKSQFDLLKELELGYDQFQELADYCKEVGIEFMSTPFDEESAVFLNSLVKRFKIGSGDMMNFPLLDTIRSFNKPMIVSTGMHSLRDILLVDSFLANSDVTFLHCTSSYPAPFDSINLKSISFLKEVLKRSIGYSDHTPGIHASVAAVALGAEVVEKHFTLDRSLPGPDHKASITPSELKDLVSAVRDIEVALGSFDKRIAPAEEDTIRVTRRGLVARVDISKGDKLTFQMLTSLRTVDSIPVDESWDLIRKGAVAIKDIPKGTPITYDIIGFSS